MKRLLLIRYVGREASNLKTARVCARKIRGAVRAGQCVLVDFDTVEPTAEFLDVLLREARADKVKFCGLSMSWQRFVADRLRKRETSP